MTARELIDSIFSRVQSGSGDVRFVTRPQLVLLRKLIDEDEYGEGALPQGLGVSVWKPPGRYKYTITEDLEGNKHSLTRSGSIETAGMASLF